MKYRLSDSFEIPDDSGEFEWTATVININKNHNENLQKNCESLYYYCAFVERVKENIAKKMPVSESVNDAVEFAIKNKYLGGFFKEQKMQILNTCLTEFNQEDYDRHRRAEGFEEGARNKSVEAALVLVRKYNASPETAASDVGAPVDAVLAALQARD